jgi:ABC-2 type transport system permease protein
VTSLVYTRFELRRTLRNRRLLFFSIGFPVIFYFLIAAPNKTNASFEKTAGLSAPLYYMTGLAAFGTMSAMFTSGGRIAGERSVGWTRQLRITPLTTRAYFRAKVTTAYMMAAISLVVLYICGSSLGVSLPAAKWIEMTALIVVALLPFAAMGVALGHVLDVDSIGPATGVSLAIFAFLGGTWFPITSGFLYDFGQLLPSWWLVQASHVALGGSAWGVKGWAVVVVWTVACTALARYAYRRDTRKV